MESSTSLLLVYCVEIQHVDLNDDSTVLSVSSPLDKACGD